MKYHWVIYNLIFPRIELDPLLQDVKTEYIEALIEACKDCCASAEYAVYKVIYNAAVLAWKQGFLDCNIACELTQRNEPRPKTILYTKEELKIFLQAVNSDFYSHRLEYYLALFCGLRPGEILGLTYDNFHPVMGILDIHKQYTRDGVLPTEQSETRYSYKILEDISFRSLKIPDFICMELNLRQQQNTCYYQNHPNSTDKHAFCISSSRGSIKTPGTLMMKERKKSKDTRHLSHHTAFGTYTPQQLIQLLAISRKEAPDLYLPMLLASTAGLQIAEIIRLTFDNVNFYNQILCLPYTSNDSFPFRADTVPREDNKVVFLSGVVMTEIQRQKERLDVLQKADPSFNLGGYLIWDRNGNRRKNNFIGKPYARILSMCPFPTFPWKNLRRIQMEPYSIKKNWKKVLRKKELWK